MYTHYGLLVMETKEVQMQFYVARKGFQCLTKVVFNWIVSQGGPMEIPKQSRLMLRQRVALHTLIAQPHCQGQYLKKLIELHGAFHVVSLVWGRYSAGYWKRNVDINPFTKSLTYNLSWLRTTLGAWWNTTCGSAQPMPNLA